MPAKHAATEKIEAEIARLEHHGIEVTPAAVLINVKDKISHGDLPVEQLVREGLLSRIRGCMKRGGYVVSDQARGTRVGFTEATISDLEAQIEIKKQSTRYDANRLRADELVLDLLRAKEQELGYEVYPGLFHAEVDRIYAMHSIDAPWTRRVAA